MPENGPESAPRYHRRTVPFRDEKSTAAARGHAVGAILPHLPDRLNIEATPGVEERLDDLFENGAVLEGGA